MNKRDLFVELFRIGEERAFELFFLMEFNNVVYFLTSYVKDESAAKDIAQESFIAMWHKRKGLRYDCNIRGYLYTIARNKALNFIRDNKLNKPSDKRKEYMLDYYALLHESVTSEIDALTLEKLIGKTYSDLPERMKKLFYMNRELGLTYREIAEKEKIPVKAVEYQIRKVLNIFRSRLRHFIPILIILCHIF